MNNLIQVRLGKYTSDALELMSVSRGQSKRHIIENALEQYIPKEFFKTEVPPAEKTEENSGPAEIF